MRSFHYSAQITADYRKYVHVYGADIDIDEFVRLFWDRRSGSKSKIPESNGSAVFSAVKRCRKPHQGMDHRFFSRANVEARTGSV
jgi:hypothetical protein